jgi:hypothetical protein
MRRALDTLIWVVVIAAISAVFYTMSPPSVEVIDGPSPPGWRSDRPRPRGPSVASIGDSALPDVIDERNVHFNVPRAENLPLQFVEQETR